MIRRREQHAPAAATATDPGPPPVWPPVNWVVAGIVAGAIGGLAGVAAVVAAALIVRWAGGPRAVLWAAIVATAAIPMATIARGLPTIDDVSSNVARQAEWPHQLAFVAATFLVLGIVMDVRTPTDGDGRRREDA